MMPALGVPLDYWVSRADQGLRGVVILADNARDDAASTDAAEVDGFGRVADRLYLGIRRPLLSGLKRPVTVVMDQVLPEHRSQVALTENQDPVQQLAAQGSQRRVRRWVRFVLGDYLSCGFEGSVAVAGVVFYRPWWRRS
jgi:hypothetical protein